MILSKLFGIIQISKPEIKKMTLLIDRVSEINEFVKKAMGMPLRGQLDWWIESSYAALFSSSFECFLMFVLAETHSEKDFDNLLQQFTKELSKKASSWFEKGFAESLPLQSRDKIKTKDFFEREIQLRLNSYFHIAVTAMADRNYQIEMARSHSCFVILSKEFEHLSTVDKSRSPEQIGMFFKNLMDLCESLAKDIHGELQTRMAT